MSYNILHLDLDEHVIMEVRKHWIVFIGQAFSLVFSALMPFILFFFTKALLPGILDFKFSNNDSALFVFIYSLWLLFLWVSFFINWTKFYLDVWYVTEKRIIAVDQRHIFSRGVSNLRFDKIQDVTVDIHGFIPTFLNFGNIKVQTAGEDNFDFFMSSVKDPEHVRKILFGKHNEIGDKDNHHI